MFHLKVLGSLSLQAGEGDRPPPLQKKRLGLLALVAIGDARGISRDRIQALLWPESDSTRARHALDQLIYATRRSLGADPVLSKGSELHLNRNVIATDLLSFEQAIAARDLEAAVAAYGGPLLDGFHLSNSTELETWIDGERARLAGVYEKTIETLARNAAAADDRAAAAAWWQKLALANPLSSRIAREVMKALERAGDKAGALQHARGYEHRIRGELGVAPDPEIKAFEKSLASSLGSDSSRTTPSVTVTTLDPNERSVSSGNAAGIGVRRGGRRRMAAITALAFAGIAIVGWASRASQSPAAKNDDALRLYLSGINAWNDRSKDGLDSAVIHFRRAVEINPTYADAYAGLANAYVMIGYSGYRPAEAMFPKAKAAALRSIQLDSTKAAPFAALGMELTWERKFADAERAFQQSMRLDPQYATAHQWHGILLMIVGKRREAIRALKRASELDPLSLQIQNNYATFLGDSGDPAARLRHYETMVAQEPDSAWVVRNPWLLTNLAAAYAANRQFDKAIRTAEQAVKILPGHPRAVGSLASVYRQMGDRDKAEQIYALADTTNQHYPAYRAMWYVADRKLDSAFMWFDRVEEWGIPILISIRNMGSRETKSDGRYVALLKKLGMPVLDESYPR